MNKHNENKKALEQALGLKFQKGRDADWGSTDIMSIKGNEYTGMFICDLEPLTGQRELVLMIRIINDEHEYEDTDVIEFNSDTDHINWFIGKLNWI